ncbi:uncharacterized protein LOC124454796 [Xenia sp. Carnegie-2017]|uniref:uncharacterized protein LOC124454796 n=1 Tax=Xenia sp. Carnegie-2017 TaxID=2897299 RepID=UPI001F047370|nr:uncharacterized protein LOC124454796 [Xenia sp. Carnegie-2017]
MHLITRKTKKMNRCKKKDSELKMLHGELTKLHTKLAINQTQWIRTTNLISRETVTDERTDPNKKNPTTEHVHLQDANEDQISEELMEDMDTYMCDSEETKQKDPYNTDPLWEPEQCNKFCDNFCIYSNVSFIIRVNEGTNKRDEPKGIVFLSQLLLLFQHCHHCFHPNPKVKTSCCGTLLIIESQCSNCKESFTWKSQPYLFGKFPAGNILLSFAILCAGASVKKVLQVFKNMGLISYSEVAYYYHQRHFLFPSIVLYWRNYQKKILESLEGKEVVLSGDGRHDSMGHSAKYGTYTIFCCTIGLIIHLVVVQANQAGSSSAMEALGHQKAMSFLLTTGLIITTFVSDRHATIAKWMRETCPKLCKELGKPVIQHFYDLWHIGKKIQKIMITLAKEKDCQILGRWRKACVRHFYWAATSTLSGIGEVKWAKFESFFYQFLNKNEDFPNTIYSRCSHSDVLKQRVWLTKGTIF